MFSFLNSTQDLRKKQIQTLTQYFQNVTETVQGSKYEIISDVPVAGGNTMMASAVQSTYPFTQPQRPSPAAPLRPLLIIVELPSDFPSKPPRILVPNERHRLIDPISYVLVPAVHQKLLSWSMHSDIGKILWEIFRGTFAAEPPIPISQQMPLSYSRPQNPLNQYASPSMIPSARTAPSSYPASPPQQQQQQQSLAKQIAASIELPSSFPEIESKSLPEVKELLDDEVKFQQFFESLAAVKEVKSLVTEMKRSNNELTEKNIALQQEIDDARSQLDAKQAAEADLRDRINQLHQLKTVIERRLSPENLVPKLNDLARQANRESDELSDRLLRGNLSTKEFLQVFQDKRKEYHLRIYKRDALTKPAQRF